MTAHRLAMASPYIRSTAIEATEFREMSTRYQVRGVPMMVVNDSWSFLGALPESEFVDAVLSGITADERPSSC